ncbi:MAG TPA: dTDP-4-dehydrorhamnose reductase [Spongiibacteraceae bacterium]|nr:dTDP-4-dehydrorhamnose reductase [Spongiibacteraceae bacterium]HCS28616.1 dTDP-4-dehydrorhamnose reductase [Spongiibacteraceae bacterium]
MRILVLGKSGQLAQSLVGFAPTQVELTVWGREELDLSNLEEIVPRLLAHAPDGVINASAYTAVDRAEQDADAAYRLNRDAVKQLGLAAAQMGCPLVHVSTDFVFDGNQSRPYQPGDACSPLGIYGASKREGESLLQQVCPAAAIVRTAWVYRAGSNNFMSTMLRLMAGRDELGVVADQVGAPTSSDNLAQVLWRVLERRLSGIWHYSDAGAASWYDFACAIYEESRQQHVIERDVVIRPLKTEQYPTPAVRPAYSVLDSSALRDAINWPAIHWQQALREQIHQLSSPH